MAPQNLEAVDFLRRFNTEVCAISAGTTAAEESTPWPQVSRPVEYGGSVGYKWNMGWITIRNTSQGSDHRKHTRATPVRLTRVSENFILRCRMTRSCTASGRARRMPGDDCSVCQSARLLQFHVRPSRQEAAVHWLRVSARSAREPRHSLTAPAEQKKNAGIHSLVRDSTALSRAAALHELGL